MASHVQLYQGNAWSTKLSLAEDMKFNEPQDQDDRQPAKCHRSVLRRPESAIPASHEASWMACTLSPYLCPMQDKTRQTPVPSSLPAPAGCYFCLFPRIQTLTSYYPHVEKQPWFSHTHFYRIVFHVENPHFHAQRYTLIETKQSRAITWRRKRSDFFKMFFCCSEILKTRADPFIQFSPKETRIVDPNFQFRRLPTM
ncbi:hypothetical protein DM02DRAFT_124437 [Periconia macrospinosa]|uniref:Uncharacterized protein n=1 Tax=Periconia macrospinosa TaxID=97972 RepID=A0A2V1DE26_9PLEO|nr:hypothetical protein DM02DRAFT_124437 [Periconia macrospinosa]